jgi:hypothetical protein
LGKLNVGDAVPSRNGKLHVERIEHLADRAKVYNIEVEDEHVYEVAHAGVLVHNTRSLFNITEMGQLTLQSNPK